MKRRSYCDLVLRTLTVEIDSSFNPDFVAALKRLPRRTWDDASERWYIPLEYLEELKKLATDHYASVHLVRGDEVTDLHTGRVFTQERLFS